MSSRAGQGRLDTSCVKPRAPILRGNEKPCDDKTRVDRTG